MSGFTVELRRRYVCDVCGKSYASSTGVKRHLPCWRSIEARGCETCASRTVRTFKSDGALTAANHCLTLKADLKRYERDCPMWRCALPTLAGGAS